MHRVANSILVILVVVSRWRFFLVFFSRLCTNFSVKFFRFFFFFRCGYFNVRCFMASVSQWVRMSSWEYMITTIAVDDADACFTEISTNAIVLLEFVTRDFYVARTPWDSSRGGFFSFYFWEWERKKWRVLENEFSWKWYTQWLWTNTAVPLVRVDLARLHWRACVRARISRTSRGTRGDWERRRLSGCEWDCEWQFVYVIERDRQRRCRRRRWLWRPPFFVRIALVSAWTGQV